MKEENKKHFLPLNLQFFASDDDVDDDDDDLNDDNAGSDDDDKGDDGKASKTFTQAEVTAMMTREKKEGRKALLKQLGFKTEKEAKDAVALYTALVDSQKSEEDKLKDKAGDLENEKNTAEQRAELAENKLSCVMAGVKNDAIDDALAVAKLKVTEEKDLDKVLAEMKKEPRYAGFFNEEGSGDDTGNKPGHNKDNDGKQKENYGASLAKGQKETSKKKTYF